MKTRSVIVILLTLVIGFVLGMLTSAQLRYHRLSPVRLYFSEERFREGFFKAIQPDSQQKARIEEVLDKYAKKNTELQNNFRRELESNMKEFRSELDQNLTKDQIGRLKDLDERRQEMTRQFRRNHKADSTSFHHDMRRMPGGPAGPGGTGPFRGHDSVNDLPEHK